MITATWRGRVAAASALKLDAAGLMVAAADYADSKVKNK
jgi:hypothetical protein